MFDLFGGPPEDWEPIPDDVLTEVPCLDQIDPAPAGMTPAIGHPDELVWQALDRHLGVETLPLITAAPIADLTPAARSLALRRLDELSAHLEAVKARVTAVITGPEPASFDSRRDDYSPHEIAVATRSSVSASDRRVSLARDLSTRLTASAAALEAGRLTYPQALALSQATGHLPVEIAREIETMMLRFSYRQDIGHFKAALRRWLASKDPDFTKKATAERNEPAVEHRATGDGCGELFIRGPLEITTQISMILTAYAAKTKDQLGGTTAQRKLQGLRDMCETYLGTPEAPRQHGRLPVLTICIDLTTLLGLRDGIAEIPGTLVQRPRRLAPALASHRPGHTPPLSLHQLQPRPRHLIPVSAETGRPAARPDTGRDQTEPPPRLSSQGVGRKGRRVPSPMRSEGLGASRPSRPMPVPTGLTCTIEPYDYRTGP